MYYFNWQWYGCYGYNSLKITSVATMAPPLVDSKHYNSFPFSPIWVDPLWSRMASSRNINIIEKCLEYFSTFSLNFLLCSYSTITFWGSTAVNGNAAQILIKLKSLVNIKSEMTQLNFWGPRVHWRGVISNCILRRLTPNLMGNRVHLQILPFRF